MEAQDLKDLRKLLGLSQMDLAVKLGVSLATIWNWESGRFKPSKMAQRAIKQLDQEMKGEGK
jgi:putative transcriptional regulator